MSKIKFEVEIDATNTQHVLAVTNFLQTIGNTAVAAAPAQAPAPKQETKKAEAPAPKQETKKAEAPKEETPKETEPAPKQETSKETEPAPKQETKKAENSIDITKVRALLATKVGDHRAAIKNELTKLGAASVSTLDSEHYQAFADFLNSL